MHAVHKRTMLLLLAIPVLYLVFWRLLPAIYTIYLSTTRFNMIYDARPVFIGVANYARLFRDGEFIASIGRTLFFAGAATGLQVGVALALALMLDRPFRAKNLVFGLLLTPMVLAPVVVGLIWRILYADRLGPINFLLQRAGLQAVPWLSDVSWALTSVVIADVWQWTPFVFLLLVAALQNVPRDIYEAATVDGAGWVQTIRFIKVPFLARIVLVAALLRFMDAFREFDKLFVMTGGGPGRATEVATLFIFRSFFQEFDVGYGSGVAVTLLVVVSLIYAAAMRILRV